jgi:hypothetical protein
MAAEGQILSTLELIQKIQEGRGVYENCFNELVETVNSVANKVRQNAIIIEELKKELVSNEATIENLHNRKNTNHEIDEEGFISLASKKQ